jgi:DNA-binding MarR family transcriptional regulator
MYFQNGIFPRCIVVRVGDATSLEDAREHLLSALTVDQQLLFSESRRVAHSFARQHALSEREFDALMVVMIAEIGGEAITPTALARRIRLSPPATTNVINKLVAAGHVIRQREGGDLRRVTLRYGARAREVAEDFFAPLSRMADAHAQDFSLEELQTVHRYLSGMATLMGAQADRGE